MESGFKDVALPDGPLAFRVPAHWREGEESDGTRTFHDAGAATGVLRVKLFTFTSDQHVGAREAGRQLAVMDRVPGQRLEQLPSGAALRTHHERTESGGERAVMHTWLLARADPPHRLRLAVFSLSIPEAQAQSPGARRVLGDIDREVRAARLTAPVN